MTQDEFDWDNEPHEMICPRCQGKGKVPYIPKPSRRARSTDPVTSHKGVKQRKGHRQLRL